MKLTKWLPRPQVQYGYSDFSRGTSTAHLNNDGTSKHHWPSSPDLLIKKSMTVNAARMKRVFSCSRDIS